jgi:hypothetical protein
VPVTKCAESGGIRITEIRIHNEVGEGGREVQKGRKSHAYIATKLMLSCGSVTWRVVCDFPLCHVPF